jgi:hypothetical protein
MERKVGEIFEYNGEWYQCVEQPKQYDCATVFELCAFSAVGNCELDKCSGTYRSDSKSVIFKKLEKVGEPHFIYDKIFKGGKVYVQNFMVYEDFKNHKPICDDYVLYDWHEKIISIEIKQNKEDMEEKKLNLKEFDLEAAKAGKPVCTRDGRKARIICFDLNNKNFPIVAIINCDTEENAYQYDIDGVCDEHDNNLNLMMSPEKKEGWVNIYKDFEDRICCIYKTKEEALEKKETEDDYITTIKIEWEE